MRCPKVQDFDVKGKKILLRVDFNVPLKGQEILDDSRLKESLPTIHYLLQKKASLILMSHLGRPKGKPQADLSLSPLIQPLSHLLNQPIQFAKDCIGEEARIKADLLKEGEILLLENLRFHIGEENPQQEPDFAKELSSLGDFYVNDAFGAAHRAHASITEIIPFFPGRCALGFLIQKELSALNSLLQDTRRPFHAIIGGAKISTKMGLLSALLQKVDHLFIGGAMAYTFLKAQGFSMGDSLVEDEELSTALEFLNSHSNQLFSLPLDHRIADRLDSKPSIKTVSNSMGIPSGWKGVDIGPQTQSQWLEHLKKGKTFFWNGPLGIYENPSFRQGTETIAQFLASSHEITVAGGGDSLAVIHALGLEKGFSHLSTGGGACLEYLEQGHLPGIDTLCAT
jgi:phosphoglycerate kinase